MKLKYPDCKICKKLATELSNSSEIIQAINDYHESKGSYELFPKQYQDLVIDIMLRI